MEFVIEFLGEIVFEIFGYFLFENGMRYSQNPKKPKILRSLVFIILCGLLFGFWALMIIFFISVVNSLHPGASFIILLIITGLGALSGFKFYRSYTATKQEMLEQEIQDNFRPKDNNEEL